MNNTYKDNLIRFGGLTGLIYGLLYFLQRVGTIPEIGFIFYFVLLAGVYFFQKVNKELASGYMSFGKGVKYGFHLSAFPAFFKAIITYIYLKFIDSAYIENSLNQARYQLEEMGYDYEMVEKSMQMTEKFMIPSILALGDFISVLILGLFLTLILTIFTKKDNPEYS